MPLSAAAGRGFTCADAPGCFGEGLARPHAWGRAFLINIRTTRRVPSASQMGRKGGTWRYVEVHKGS